MIDDARQSKSLAPVAANDNDYRIISQVSASPGQAKVRDASGVDVTVADATTRTAVNGGFNHEHDAVLGIASDRPGDVGHG